MNVIFAGQKLIWRSIVHITARVLPCVVLIITNSGHGASQEATLGSTLRIKNCLGLLLQLCSTMLGEGL